ncbi:phospholipase A2 inhibitor and Ly6/PLAUR domain-containing protein-like [Mastacembelus armatus]|uniref:phospholipase A2 inhibitor and Ly6/PLAUR domain-containing protein-like n=1 Tax=Mastacembelus armatus TaxID=205130 RepID=UPI000E45E7A8|nr:phospholipase A2 inhibitor and Ly6/PLAUR domain-containing protein-like [Mastacembelus armatus]
MKLILSLPLIWTLFSTAGALVCQTCTDTQCSTTEAQTCSTETMCITASFEATAAGGSAPPTYKACASSSLCPVTGFQTLSVNLGGSSGISYSYCCNSDNCNSATLPTPTPQPTNTLQCLTCDATTSQCTSSVQCTGVQDRCFTATSDTKGFCHSNGRLNCFPVETSQPIGCGHHDTNHTSTHHSTNHTSTHHSTNHTSTHHSTNHTSTHHSTNHTSTHHGTNRTKTHHRNSCQ